MAWHSHGDSNKGLVEALVKNCILRSKRAASAMLAVDRALYCRTSSSPYYDAPLPIGYSATISAPHMHANCLQLLEPHLFKGAKVLDIGSGSGYLVAVFAEMVKRSADDSKPSSTDDSKPLVFGIEHIPELTEWSRDNLRKSPRTAELLERGVINVSTGDGRLGMKAFAPFDAIHVGAASPTTPQALIDQLALGGRLLIPVGTDEQEMIAYDRDAVTGEVKKTTLFGVRYVPLTDRESQLRDTQVRSEHGSSFLK
jgi:protein-L-isoaspartate(D-aspartate) O-methyltransferase